MAVQTGTTTTVRQPIKITYTCSKCGWKNNATGTLYGSAFSSVLIRVNAYQEATQKIRDQINTLTSGPIPERYANAELPCSCRRCQHVEPWAKLRNRKLPGVLFWLPLILAVYSAIVFMQGPNVTPTMRCLVCACGLLPGVIVWMIKQFRRAKLMNAIKELPRESLPDIGYM